MTILGLVNLCLAIFTFVFALIYIKEERYGWALWFATLTCLNIFAALSTSSLIK